MIVNARCAMITPMPTPQESYCERFLAEYRHVFAEVERALRKPSAPSARRLRTQQLFNELLLARLVQTKGWPWPVASEIHAPLAKQITAFLDRFTFSLSETDGGTAINPEMLGRVFEELVTGRHEHGSYYTPRPVVSFMCREALKGYLVCCAETPSALADFIDHADPALLRDPQRVRGALGEVTVCDPACGSGAYLIGMLQELLRLRRSLAGDRRDEAAHKRAIIETNLYGVDLDPLAANIAKLRLWLALLADSSADAPPALYDLNLNIACGDSLTMLAEMPPFNPQSAVRNPQSTEGSGFRVQGSGAACDGEPRHHSPLTAHHSQLTTHHSPITIHHFNIVLANPPYVRKENIPAKTKPLLRRMYGSAVTNQSDLYCYFYVRGMQLLRDGGMHVFICSNSWLDSSYGSALQQYLLSHGHVQAIYDSAVQKQFATAEVNTIITVIRKQKPSDADKTTFVMLRAPFADALGDPTLRTEVTATRAELWSGNKWGGKYLRAPDIYRRIIEQTGPRLIRLSALADVCGYIHDNNTGRRFPKVPFLKSLKNVETILVTPQSPGVINYGVKPDGNSRWPAPILFPRTFGSRHVVVWNPDGVFGKEFYKIVPRESRLALSIVAQLNSTWGILQRELLGLVNLGDGAIKFSIADVELFELIPDLPSENMAAAFLAMASRPQCELSVELEQPDRRELDRIVFDALRLSAPQREELYRQTLAVARARLAKAGSLPRPRVVIGH
ncbi:MAG TPA: N-6 DNA methylase [Planctomycetota bacterium]